MFPAYPGPAPPAPDPADGPRFEVDGSWRTAYRAAGASTKVLDRFGAFRSAHPPLSLTSEAQTWRYRVGGAARGPLLLITPDRYAPAEACWRLFESLAPFARVALLEHAAGVHGEDLVQGLCAVIRAEARAPAVLIGVGAGGLSAQRLADRRPELVAGMALLNATAPMPRFAGRLKRRARLLARLPHRWGRLLQRRAFARVLACPTDEAGFWRGFVEEALPALSPAAAAAAAAQAAELHLIGGDSPSGLRAPVILFQSESDSSEPQPAQRRLAARYPHAERICFSFQAGHTLEISRAREVAQAIQRFLLTAPPA